MKTLPNLLKVLGVLTVLVLVSGCESNKQFKENALLQAGFKAVPATTAAQQAHLMTIPQKKVSPVMRSGTQYYVYPDVANNVLYVGRQAEYAAYKRNKSAQEQELDNTMAIQSNFVSDDAYLTSFSSWGPWQGLPW